jgi:hypothetical protein
MKNQTFVKSLTRLFIAALIAMLTISVEPAQTVRAETTSTSDLAIQLVSAPQHAKACQIVTATFIIKNLGPDKATSLYVQMLIPDQFGDIALLGVPDSLAVGQSATITAVLKVVAFVPGESRSAWIGAYVVSDPFPNISIDPNSANSEFSTPVRMISKPVDICP